MSLALFNRLIRLSSLRTLPNAYTYLKDTGEKKESS